MKTKYLSLIISGLMLCVVSCKKSNTGQVGLTADIYVAGYLDAETPQAAYWKNGVLYKLTDSPTYAIARSIAVQGSDVYTAGFIGANQRAVYWKNNVPNFLGDPSTVSQAMGITISGNDIYVAGIISPGGVPQGIYWKNGVANTIPGSFTATAIAISGNDVYVAGNYGNGDSNVTAYWKNGVAVTLPGGLSTNVIVVSGNDVYVGGITTDGNAVYWKNGVANILTQSSSSSSVNGIVVSDGNVYVAGGSPADFSGSTLTMWKNNTPVSLPVPGTLPSNATGAITNNMTTSVAVVGTDVYVTGQVFNSSLQLYKSFYWKNGNPVALSDGGNNGAFAVSIVVVPKAQ